MDEKLKNISAKNLIIVTQRKCTSMLLSETPKINF